MRGESMKGKSKKSTYSTTFGVDPCRMRGESMKDKSKKSTYSTTFGVDPFTPFTRGNHKSPSAVCKKKRGKNRVYKWRALRESNPQPSDP